MQWPLTCKHLVCNRAWSQWISIICTRSTISQAGDVGAVHGTSSSAAPVLGVTRTGWWWGSPLTPGFPRDRFLHMTGLAEVKDEACEKTQCPRDTSNYDMTIMYDTFVILFLDHLNIQKDILCKNYLCLAVEKVLFFCEWLKWGILTKTEAALCAVSWSKIRDTFDVAQLKIPSIWETSDSSFCVVLSSRNSIWIDTESECLSYWNHNKPADSGAKQMLRCYWKLINCKLQHLWSKDRLQLQLR